MENNVHHDVYNADVCTRATERGGGENAEGEEREKDRVGRAEWRREGRRESKRRDREERRARLTIRERKMTIKGGKGERGTGR